MQEPLRVDQQKKDKLKWRELSCTNGNCQSEAKEIIKLGVPIGFSTATSLLQYFTDQSMVGHLGTDYLAASSMAGILMNIFSTYIESFCASINVLSSQAFGANNLPRVSEWLQVGAVLVAILSLPAFIASLYGEQIFLLCGASKHIASLSGQFTRWSMISILPRCQFMAISNYFKSQSNVLPATYISAVMILFNILINLMLVYGYIINWFMQKINGTHWNGLGFIGSPIATSITQTTQLFVYIFYMFYWKKYHITSGTWSSFKVSTFSWHRIKTFLTVAIPQAISAALENWQIQIVAFFASGLADAELAAFSSSITIILILDTAAVGISDGIAVRVGYFLGANDPKYAKYVAWVGVIIGVTVGGVIGVLLATVGKYFAYVVSGGQEIYDLYAQVFPVVGGAFFVMGVFTVVTGVLLAQARTRWLSICALCCCWGVSVPLSYLFGIYWGYGIKGIYDGLVIGYILFAISAFIIFLNSDWEQCVIDAVNRITPTNKIVNGVEANNDGMRKNGDVDNRFLYKYNPLLSDELTASPKLRDNDEN